MNKSQSYISIFVLFFILTLVFYSCAKEKEYGIPVTPEEVESLEKEGIEPDALPCDIKIIETWEFHHYEPKAGKTVGIWPANKYINDTNKFNQLKNKWGFSKYYHANAWNETTFNLALKVGFSKNNIWVGLTKNNYHEKIGIYGTVGAYYLDEPYSKNNVSISTFCNIANEIKTRTNNSLFITGDNAPVSCLDSYVKIADHILCTSYKNGYLLFGCVYAWWPEDKDQRPLWTLFRIKYGFTKNKFNWIAAHADQNEFYDLIPWAFSMGNDDLWFYQLENDSETILMNFCGAAYSSGYLRRFYQKVKRYYECTEHNCDICSVGGNWSCYRTDYGEIREFYLIY